MDPSALQAKAAFEALFRRMAPERHRYDVFRDFVAMAACTLHNGLHKDPTREAEYLEIIARYKPDDQACCRLVRMLLLGKIRPP